MAAAAPRADRQERLLQTQITLLMLTTLEFARRRNVYDHVIPRLSKQAGGSRSVSRPSGRRIELVGFCCRR